MNHRNLGQVRHALLLLFACLATTLAFPALAAAQDGDGDWRYGVIDSTDDPAGATRLGASWTRLRFQWAEVQADGPDSWDPPVDDEALEMELNDGRLVVGLLIGIPDWARDRDKLPEGLYLPHTDPDNTWAVFVREAVSRYEGQIDHWIIWNEPDIDDPKALGHTWDGTAEDFAQLLRVAYLVAKDTNPDAVVHLGAFTYFWDETYFSRFLDILIADPQAADNHYYFDVATAHLYFQPERVYDVINAFRDDMTTRGLSKPIWLVETNAPPADDPYWLVDDWTLNVTLYEQAAFVPQAISSALAAGADRIAVYKLKDVAGDRDANPEPFGLLRQDNSRRPAFDSYRVAIDVLGDARAAVRERWDAVGQIRLDQRDQTTTVLFSRLPETQEAVVLAEASTAELVDMWGKRRTVAAQGNSFVVELQPALCSQTIGDYCMIGGSVMYLIQKKSDGPANALPPEEELSSASGPQLPAAFATPLAEANDATNVPAATPMATDAAAPEGQPPSGLDVASQPEAPLAVAPQPVAQSIDIELPTVTPAPEVAAANVNQKTRTLGTNTGYIFLGLGLLGAIVIGGWLIRTRQRG